MLKLKLTSIIWATVCLASYAQINNASQSPFANKPADSYSNYTGADGKPAVLLWGSANPLDFGSRDIKFDQSGIRQVNQIPAPGIHPRIFFTPDDLPDMRKRLKETQCGQAAWKNILSWTEMMKGNYDDKADYAQPDVWKGSFGGLHGRVPLFRLGVPRLNGIAYNHNTLAAGYYQKLVDGTATEFPAFYWNVFSLEAFRCLIANDEQGAKTLAKAVITALRIDQQKRDKARADEAEKKHTELKPIEQPIGAFQLAYTYDFIFNWLTSDQKQAIHDELAATTWSHDNYGTFNTATSSRSNWATFSYWLIEVLAIEGEPGFNDLKVRGMYRGWRNLLTYGWYQSGATFEGEAKNQLGMDGILPFAIRTKQYGFDNLCGHPYLRAYADKFLPHSVIPTQDGFIRYDLLGGSHGKGGGATTCDLLGLKYMFPNDKTIDWVYRKAVTDDYSNVADRPDGYYNGLLFYAMFATDFDPTNTDPAKLNLGNTFFCGERALMMTRSSWDTNDALMLNLHTRQANGGHPSADRNSIQLAGAGRVWAPVQGGYAFDNYKNSVVVIDNKPQMVSVPGTMVDFSDSPMATFCTGDAKYCWDWNWQTLNKKRDYYTIDDVNSGAVQIPAGFEAEKHTTNDFAYLKLPFAYLNKPLFQNPHWILPNGAISPVVRQPNYPVQRAFRTAGIIRGKHPYGIVVDDIKKDDTEHHYDWILTVEYDVQIVKINKINDHEMDIILTGSDPSQKNSWPKEPLPVMFSGSIPAKQPMLLVRVINRNTKKDETNSAAADPTIVEIAPRPKTVESHVRKLVIPADAVSPDYKVLLFPYRNGDSLPETAWNNRKGTLDVKWVDQKNKLQFLTKTDGSTRVSLVDDINKQWAKKNDV